MAERLKRQRDEYETQIAKLHAELATAKAAHITEIKRTAKLEAKLEMLAALLNN
jgi:hypothetical protein